MLPLSDPQDNNLDKSSFHDQLDLPVADSSYFPFPPTIFCLDGVFHDLLLLPSNSASDVTMSRLQEAEAPQNPDHPAYSAPLYVAAGMGDGSCGARRVKSTRKDRHSKIFTARGPRDRRMRLSIDVARRFFHLQDMLGFDKASKTVQWLLTMSKAAIKDLAATASCSNQSSKSTESSTLSGPKSKSSKCQFKSKFSTVTTGADQERKTKVKRGASKPSRKTNLIDSALARESRAKARERARERTKEKRKNLASLSSPIPLDAIKEESSSLNHKSIYHDLADDKERKSCLNMAAASAAASERAYEYPAITGSGLLQVPGFGNNNLQGGVAAAAAAAAAAISVDAAGSIFQEEYWADMDSFYSR